MGRLTDHEWRRLLEEQVANHGRLLFRMAFRVVRDHSLAEELCQQALLKAWQRRGAREQGAARVNWGIGVYRGLAAAAVLLIGFGVFYGGRISSRLAAPGEAVAVVGTPELLSVGDVASSAAAFRQVATVFEDQAGWVVLAGGRVGTGAAGSPGCAVGDTDGGPPAYGQIVTGHESYRVSAAMAEVRQPAATPLSGVSL